MGIGLDGVISGDSLFGRQPGAAAIAVADMSNRLSQACGVLIDAQWDGPLLRSLGATPMPRERYLRLLDRPPEPVSLPVARLQAERLLRAAGLRRRLNRAAAGCRSRALLSLVSVPSQTDASPTGGPPRCQSMTYGR